jgi:nitrogen-specific signal transduction histidine kinase/CheY-like chemotaxis protein
MSGSSGAKPTSAVDETAANEDTETVPSSESGHRASSGSGSSNRAFLPSEGQNISSSALDAMQEDDANSNSLKEIERLREAMDHQLRLIQQRERLVNQQRKGEKQTPLPGGKLRVSPIHEEAVTSNVLDSNSLAGTLDTTTSSTESGRTIRGGDTPAAVATRTPSYPFPPMKTPSRMMSGHRPFTALSPTVAPENYSAGAFAGPRDQMLSGSVTPSSTLNFQPTGPDSVKEDPNFPRPNLYDLSLILSAEPGLDPWWNAVVEIMRDLYKADRVTLAVPADATDMENVPWGQKATYNSTEEDQLSLTYLPGGSSLAPSSGDTQDTSHSEPSSVEDPGVPSTSQFRATRPVLPTRHSFTTFEDTKRQPGSRSGTMGESRPSAFLSRSKSYLPGTPEQPPPTSAPHNAHFNMQSLEDDLANEKSKEPYPSWEHHEAAFRQTKGRLFPVLQALDYEADALLDSSGVIRVLERGNVIALTRDFPYIESNESEPSGGSKSSQKGSAVKGLASDMPSKGKPALPISRTSSFLGTQKSSRRSSRASKCQMSEGLKTAAAGTHAQDVPIEPPCRYEEYEQAPPSPWSQSPAPSPAVRADPNENPFFANAQIDEESFNPAHTPHDYSSMQQVEAIGMDRSCTVLHIPLYHVLLSKPVQSFRLDTAVMESRYGGRTKSPHEQEHDIHKTLPTMKEKRSPIAILSILTPVIPYPSSLRHSLEHLAPHLATSFSLCRHYTNLENQIAGLSRRRPNTSGFGAVTPNTRRAKNDTTAVSGLSHFSGGDPLQSVAGSLTSPSDYSGMSKSAECSPTGTPGWNAGSVRFSTDKTLSSDSLSYIGEDGYFGSKSRPPLGRLDTGSAASITGARRSSKDNSPSECRRTTKAFRDEKETLEQAGSDRRGSSDSSKVKREQVLSTADHQATPASKQARTESAARDQSADHIEVLDSSSSRANAGESAPSPRRVAIRTSSANAQSASSRADRPHTQLHSYGADFASIFQSLPATTATPTKAAAASASSPTSRSGSISGPIDMPPPSDRLKTLMLDTLPAHLFVALPQTGEIVWVNNRYLTYRGQTVADLYQDPWSSIHPEERDDYLKAWTHAIRSGEQFSMQVRIRRFDGNYRWFYTRAVGGRDTRGVIVQWYGSYMDIHDQHIAEVKAARQEEIEASEAKHRLLANLIPQIIFAATENEGVTFANEQWLSYTGQKFDDALGLGFMDYVHPEDLAKCHIPTDRPPMQTSKGKSRRAFESSDRNVSNPTTKSEKCGSEPNTPGVTVKGMHQALSRTNSSSSESVYELHSADLSELAKSGVIKVTIDSNDRLSYMTEVRLRGKSGEYRWHLVRCVQVDNINFGSGDGSWFGACTDINDHKLLETKLKEAMESKSQFLSRMSHEIRTPLIGISGMVSFLQDTVLNEEQLDYTNTIQTSANSLLMIINDILDLSKVDAGMMKLSYEWFHTSSLIEDVNELVSTMAISKHLELNYVVDEDVPPMVKGDRVRIRQVLLNVIGNAIKFTSEGEVFSTCRVYHDKDDELEKNEIMLEYSILDTGSGFTKEEAELIFKPFSQIDGSSTRQHGGSGLGLVISRQLVELHGGQMDGTSVPGKGSTFNFTAKFRLPTEDDRPDPPMTPMLTKTEIDAQALASAEVSARALKSAGGNAVLSHKLMQSSTAISPVTDNSFSSPPTASSTSSNPSTGSLHTRATHRSSVSSANDSFMQFNQAARAKSQDVSIKLSLPHRSVTDHSSHQSSSPHLPVPEQAKLFRPPLYSILVVCPQTHSREATRKHMEMTLPKDVPHQITSLASHEEAQKLLGGEDPVLFTHIVLNLSLPEEIIAMMDQILASPSMAHTSIVILSDPVQRQAVLKMATHYDYDELAKTGRVTFICKPVKPSRFAVIFDPGKERDLSTDRNRSSAKQLVATQKQHYVDVKRRLGNKGLKILLVEDNLTNQKVLLRFLSKVEIEVETAFDGVEGTDKVFAKPQGFYSLILVSVFSLRQSPLSAYSVGSGSG